MRENPTTAWNCETAIAALQRELDGDGPALDAGLSRHLEYCVECRERFAAARMFLTAYPPPPSAALADRIAVAVRDDTRHQKWRATFAAAVGIAACLVIAFRVMMPAPLAPEVPVMAEAPKSFGSRLADARAAVQQSTVDIVQAIPKPDDLTMVNADDFGVAFEPAANHLAEATRGLADGLQPVTDSARRAFAMFRRELPTEK